jgi:hypothetical protein
MSRKKANIHYVYKTTCNITGRYYIGIHSTTNIEDGYMGSGLILRRSIRKYGINNHKREILEYVPSRDILFIREAEIVNEEIILDDLCMNLRKGGQGGFTIESAKKGREKTNEILKEKYGENYKSIISKLFLKNCSEEEKNEWVQKIKDGQKTSGFDFGTFRGKTHSEETKQKMSESSKGMGIGESNSQYGTCWITKDETNKKIKKEDLDTYLNEGWVKGRK